MTTTYVWRPSSARRIVLDGFVPVPRGTLPSVPPPMSWPAKDPADVLDYEFDISAALVGNEGDSIATVTANVMPAGSGGLTVSSIAVDGACAVLWCAGGRAGTTYVVQINITTASGRVLGRAVLLPVMQLTTAVAPANALVTNLGSVVTDQNGNPILLGS